MKKAACLIIAVWLLLWLAGCNVRNNPPVRPLAESPNATAIVPTEGVPAEPFATAAPGKTASQDTAGAVTRLPEAATAQGATTEP